MNLIINPEYGRYSILEVAAGNGKNLSSGILW